MRNFADKIMLDILVTPDIPIKRYHLYSVIDMGNNLSYK